jgi:hypothetical protein
MVERVIAVFVTPHPAESPLQAPHPKTRQFSVSQGLQSRFLLVEPRGAQRVKHDSKPEQYESEQHPVEQYQTCAQLPGI